MYLQDDSLILVSRMWEKGWEDDVQEWSVEPEQAYNPAKIHRIEFDGSSSSRVVIEPGHMSNQD